MEFEVLQKEVFRLAVEGRSAEAETYMVQNKSEFHGRSLGRWHRLFAQIVQRNRSEDHNGFLTACSEAAKLLQGEQADLCDLYVIQAAAMMEWGDWRSVRTYIRRLRAMFRRHPSLYEVQRLQGLVLLQEGFVERIAGNYPRAIDCLSAGIEAINRYLYPVDESARTQLSAQSYGNISDCYLHLGDHGKAVEYLSKTDATAFPLRERCRYDYVQSRYWLALGNPDKATEWLAKIGTDQSWEPDWPALVLELKADIARAQNQFTNSCDLLKQGLEQVAENNSTLRSRLQQKLQFCERMQSK